jgi:dolichol-phosphate mannosyltransferase
LPAAWLILPTYNEAENIESLVRAALPRLEESDAEPRVLIVDDGSPDGTGEIADRLADELAPVEVLHRPRKQGLGRAYLAGFAVALERGADLLLEMDSDFSHDPADLPRLISAAGAADLVLGSRYVPGGGITEWGAIRRLLSRGGSAYARWLLGVPVRDLTGGFKCFRREVLEAIDLDAVHADGYGFQIELTYRAVQAGFTVTEVPIVFRERRLGRSKMTMRIALEAVWKVPALRLRLRQPAAAAPAAQGTQQATGQGGDHH